MKPYVGDLVKYKGLETSVYKTDTISSILCIFSNYSIIDMWYNLSDKELQIGNVLNIGQYELI